MNAIQNVQDKSHAVGPGRMSKDWIRRTQAPIFKRGEGQGLNKTVNMTERLENGENVTQK